MKQRSIYIPVAPMQSVCKGNIVELLFDKFLINPRRSLIDLQRCGFSNALKLACKAVRSFSSEKSFCSSFLTPVILPRIVAVNPSANITNLSSASLGIALGLLLYRSKSPFKIMATGSFSLNKHNQDKLRNVKAYNITAQFKVAQYLGPQTEPLFYYVPEHLECGATVSELYAKEMVALRTRNIWVQPIGSLQQAISSFRNNGNI